MAKVLREKKTKEKISWVTASVLQITAAKIKNNENEISFALYLFMQHGGLFLIFNGHWSQISAHHIFNYACDSIDEFKRTLG